MTLPVFLARIVEWLRAGYPDGVPARDYVPLVALLGSHLSDDEMTLIADELAFSADPQSAEEIKKAIGAITRAEAGDAEVARVRSRLEAAGWPLDAPGRD